MSTYKAVSNYGTAAPVMFPQNGVVWAPACPSCFHLDVSTPCVSGHPSGCMLIAQYSTHGESDMEIFSVSKGLNTYKVLGTKHVISGRHPERLLKLQFYLSVSSCSLSFLVSLVRGSAAPLDYGHQHCRKGQLCIDQPPPQP